MAKIKYLQLLIILLLITTRANTAHAELTNDTSKCLSAKAPIYSIKVSPDGKSVLGNWTSGTSRLWDLETGNELHTFTQNNDQYVDSVDFSPNGKYLLTSSLNEAIMWDAQTYQQVRIFTHNKSLVGWGEVKEISARFTPDGKYVLTASYGSVIVWDAVSGDKIRIFGEQEGNGGIDSLHARLFDWLSPDGKYIVAIDSDQNGRQLWNLLTGQREHFLKNAYHVEFILDGSSIIIANDNGISVLDVTTLNETFFYDADFAAWWISSPNGRYFLVVLPNLPNDPHRSFELWDTQTGQKIHSFVFDETILEFRFLPDSNQIMFIEFSFPSSEILIWDIAQQKEISRSTPTGILTDIRKVVLLPDSKRMLLGSEAGTLQLWDIYSGELLVEYC